MAYALTVNGVAHTLDVDEDTPLLWALRDELNLTGTRFGCGVAACGACSVYVDGVLSRSCQTTVADADGADVVTIEGAQGAEVEAVRQAWRELDVAQCGWCQSGQILAAADLLKASPKPSDDDITDAMNGNVCRCATYVRIRAGVRRASEILEG